MSTRSKRQVPWRLGELSPPAEEAASREAAGPAAAAVNPASWADGSPSALYNMALGVRGVGSDFVSCTLSIDKLRLQGVTLTRGEDLVSNLMGGADRQGHGRARNRGSRQVDRHWAAWGSAEDGGAVYFQIDCEGGGTRLLTVEFNPAKLDDHRWLSLSMSLAALGFVDRDRERWVDPAKLMVDRVDAAMDYSIMRGAALLDDRTRLADYFGVGTWGPQTERTGYRRGSRLKFQVYDKQAERAAKGITDGLGGPLTRFEVQAHKPDPLPSAALYGHPGGERMSLADLPWLPWPGGDVTMRRMTWDPATLKNPLFTGAGIMARFIGMRAADNWLRICGVSPIRRADWAHSCIPEIRPSPRAAWRSQFNSAAAAVVERLACGGHSSVRSSGWWSVGLPGESPSPQGSN